MNCWRISWWSAVCWSNCSSTPLAAITNKLVRRLRRRRRRGFCQIWLSQNYVMDWPSDFGSWFEELRILTCWLLHYALACNFRNRGLTSWPHNRPLAITTHKEQGNQSPKVPTYLYTQLSLLTNLCVPCFRSFKCYHQNSSSNNLIPEWVLS